MKFEKVLDEVIKTIDPEAKMNCKILRASPVKIPKKFNVFQSGREGWGPGGRERSFELGTKLGPTTLPSIFLSRVSPISQPDNSNFKPSFLYQSPNKDIPTQKLTK